MRCRSGGCCATPASASESVERFERALAFLRGTLAGCVDSFAAVEGGWLALTPSLPRVWYGNQLRLRGPVDAGFLLAAAERHLSGLPFRHVVVEGDGAGLEEPARSIGWSVSREVVMALERQPRPRRDGPAVAELEEAAWAAAHRLWHFEDPRITADDADQLVVMALREGRVHGDLRLGVLDAGGGGSALAIASLRSDRCVAQVEDVWTAPQARGRGYARALVTHALLTDAAEQELTFIVADDDDWPKELYARLGFAPLGRVWSFHRPG